MLYRDYRRIEGNEDYIISNYGEVISLKGKKPRILKTCCDLKGYKMVNIRPTTKVHVLVGNAFVGKRENGLTFDHIDRDNTNNRADNIRLATKSEQAENTKMKITNKLGVRNIMERENKRNGIVYYRIKITLNNQQYLKEFNKSKYSLEEVIKIRDDAYEKLKNKVI